MAICWDLAWYERFYQMLSPPFDLNSKSDLDKEGQVPDQTSSLLRPVGTPATVDQRLCCGMERGRRDAGYTVFGEGGRMRGRVGDV